MEVELTTQAPGFEQLRRAFRLRSKRDNRDVYRSPGGDTAVADILDSLRRMNAVGGNHGINS